MSFKDTIIAKNVIIPFDENTLNIKGEKNFCWLCMERKQGYR